MREELVALLKVSFEAGIITSIARAKIDAIKKEINMSDAEYQQIEDQIRIAAYLHKIKEREKKGVTFMGDLRKQYKITEDDKVIIQEILTSEQAKEQESSKTAVPQKQSEIPDLQKKLETTDKTEPPPPILHDMPKETVQQKQPKRKSVRETVKRSDSLKKEVLPEKSESSTQKESSKTTDSDVQSEEKEQLELLKQNAHMPAVEAVIVPEPAKKQESTIKTVPDNQPDGKNKSGVPDQHEQEVVSVREIAKAPESSEDQNQAANLEQSSQKEVAKKEDVVKESGEAEGLELLKQQEQMQIPGTTDFPASPKKQELPKKLEPTKKTSGEIPFILIADDNETHLFITKKIIEEYGYSCITTDSPETTIRIISEKRPAMVFCDVNFGIGKPTGMDVFANIRAKNIDIPFIIVSAFFQKEFKDHAKRIGITDYLTKPIDEHHLIATIKKYFAR